jgi:hypothetical protein
MATMQRFGDATGLRINVGKSTIAPIRCSQVNLDEVLQNFRGTQVSYPICYLGLPVTLGRLKLVHLQSVFDRAATKLAGWQGQLLKLGGHRELVRTVLDSKKKLACRGMTAPTVLY